MENWVVKVEPIHNRTEGLSEFCDYVENPNHKNHKNTKIFPIMGSSQNFFRSAVLNATELNLANQKKKGGRPVQSYAQSFCLTLPKMFKPTLKQWKRIAAYVAKDICEHLELPKENWRDFMFSNLHEQDNSHLNFLVSKVYAGSRLKKLDQYSTTHLVKQSFTRAVLKECSLSVEAYEPEWNTPKKLDEEGKAFPTRSVRKWMLNYEKLSIAANDWICACKAKKEKEKELAEQRFLALEEILSKVRSKRVHEKIHQLRLEIEKATQESMPKIKY